MRVLVTTQPSRGSFSPLVPFAHALVDAGRAVDVACATSFCPVVEATGLAAVPAGMD